MIRLFKSIVCIFKGHKWEIYYRGNNKICGRCEKVVPIKLDNSKEE